jgi:tetratricopeptide (TPR) repeat protein
MSQNYKQIKLVLGGKEYLWNGSYWIDLESFLVPPQQIIEELNKLLNEVDFDYKKLPINDLKKLASNFKDNGNNVKAIEIIEYILNKTPNESATLSILCSLLRKIGKPEEAIKRTNNYNLSNAALLTSRAAAMCDLGQWENAKKEVGRALAIIKGNNGKHEAFNVVNRIKENRPDLY